MQKERKTLWNENAWEAEVGTWQGQGSFFSIRFTDTGEKIVLN